MRNFCKQVDKHRMASVLHWIFWELLLLYETF